MSKSLSLEAVSQISQSEIVSVQISCLITLCGNPILTLSNLTLIAYFRFTNTGGQLSSSLNYFVLKTLQVWVRTTHPDVLSSVKKLKPLFRCQVLLKKGEPSLRGERINSHKHSNFAGGNSVCCIKHYTSENMFHRHCLQCLR